MLKNPDQGLLGRASPPGYCPPHCTQVQGGELKSSFSFPILLGKPLSHTAKNASLIKVTRAGTFALSGSCLTANPLATTNQGFKGTCQGLGIS